MKKEQPRERIREEMQERPARSRNTSSSAASTRKKAARSARPTGSVSHTQQTKSKSARPVSPAQARRNPGGTPEKTPQKEFPSGYSNGASSGSRIVWRRVLLIAEGTFLWQTGTGI